MKLYLHCGYHKTGSSFLQTLFARNRKTLEASGIYFPIADREYDMQAGNISPGNGLKLAKALQNSDQSEVFGLLNRYIKNTVRKNCDSILLSSEYLFDAFEAKDAFSCLTDTAENLDIDTIEALIYFRDPESHILSTYKHRNKSGTLPNFSEWLRNEYETMRLIQCFTEYREVSPIFWNCRLYKPNSEHLAASAFVDWLKLDKPEIPTDDNVNVSLTLSEILIIQIMREWYPSSTNFLQEEFGALTSNEKATDGVLLMKYRSAIREWLIPFQDLVDEINRILPDNEKMEIKDSPEKDKLNTTVISIEKPQVTAFARAVEKSLKSDCFNSKVQRVGQQILSKIKHEFAKRSNH